MVVVQEKEKQSVAQFVVVYLFVGSEGGGGED